MFTIRAKTQGIDGIHVSDNLLRQTVICSHIPRLQTGIAGAAEQKTAVGAITKGKHGIGMCLPLLFQGITIEIEYTDKVVAIADGDLAIPYRYRTGAFF